MTHEELAGLLWAVLSALWRLRLLEQPSDDYVMFLVGKVVTTGAGEDDG
jgi:hypothetical protein